MQYIALRLSKWQPTAVPFPQNIAAGVGAAKCGKIQTLAPGATAPESRVQHPKTKIIGEIF